VGHEERLPRPAARGVLDVFLDLLVDPDAASVTTSPISMELNEALREIEGE
jgi:hypothetical protein